MNHYLVTFIHGSVRDVRNIVAHSARNATRIALASFSDTDEPCCVICKPISRSAT